MKPHNRARVRWALLLTTILTVTASSVTARQRAELHPMDDPYNQMGCRAGVAAIDGNFALAVGKVDLQVKIARDNPNMAESRAQLCNCAMDYSLYGRRDKAVALLEPLTHLSDDIGKLSRDVMAQMKAEAPGWGVYHLAPKPFRAHLKAAKERECRA